MDLTNKQPIPQNADDARLMEVLARPPARSDELNAMSSNVKTSTPTSITSYPECSALPSSPSTSLAITKQPFRKFKPAISRTYTGGPSSSTSRPLSSLSTGNRSEPSSSAIVTEQESYLINFLRACNPPMDHYYDCFIKAGCRNYQYLFALSTWPKETRRSFLKSLGSAEGGSKPTGMDVLVIDHFLEVAFGLAD
ncbi:hypothetical protein BJ165DRAFT_1460239 [Panaeolus papilionaceus]|nr:hypothetical protein BJ165DRAFT_1460239 [Panaeolus papilionaceus]